GMATDPARRYRSIGEWHDALRRGLERRRPTGDESHRTDDELPSTPTEVRRQWPARFVAAALTVVVVGAALVIASRSGDRDPAPLPDDRTTSTPDPNRAATIDAVTEPTSTPSAPPLVSEPLVSSRPASSASSYRAGPASTTEATIVSTTADTPTSAVAAPGATLDTTTTTIDPRFEFSPRAFIESPTDESVVTGDLRITGDARYRDGVVGVTLVIRREQDDHVWHDVSRSFEPGWIRFPVEVTPPGGTEATWSYTVDGESLAPGRYLIRVWATGTDANDPVSDQRHIIIG
ncbi:MAG: hypothetical protein ACR2QK_08410, partial [Acidimicrobiales bacterium]